MVAMEVLLELGDITRFARAKTLGAYVGLTPSQHSSGAHIRLGHITHTGKPTLRALLIQAAWQAIRKDPVLEQRYERLQHRRGGKRAIVGVARQLLGRMRRLLLDHQPYVVGFAG
jgi:transposase